MLQCCNEEEAVSVEDGEEGLGEGEVVVLDVLHGLCTNGVVWGVSAVA